MGEHRPDAKPAAAESPVRRMPRWKKTLLVVSVLLMVLGAAMHVYGLVQADPETRPPPTATDPVLASGLAAGATATDGSAEAATSSSDTGAAAWSPAMFRLGFSFFVGFAIAFALRTFIKISITAMGLLLLALFGLQYAGVIDVDWSAMSGHYDTARAWLSEQTRSMTDFIRGYLPSTASGALGVAAGFKKH